MRYLVMEIHPAYAVLLDEEGRYLKAANLRYQVGDTVGDMIPLREPAPKTVRIGRPLAGLAAMAACLCLVFFGYYQPNFTAYGSLRIQINPDVEMTISRTERVLALEGLNQDGMDLIEGYDYQGKRRDTATDELVERAIDMGYLSGGDTISITVSSPDAVWRAEEEAQVRRALEDRYGEQVTIRIGVVQDGDQPAEKPPQEVEVVIPVSPPTPSPAGTDRPYDGSDDGPGPDGTTGYGETDYGPSGGNATDYSPSGGEIGDYGDTAYAPYGDGVTDHEDRHGASGGEDENTEDDRIEDDDAEDGDGDDSAGGVDEAPDGVDEAPDGADDDDPDGDDEAEDGGCDDNADGPDDDDN